VEVEVHPNRPLPPRSSLPTFHSSAQHIINRCPHCHPIRNESAPRGEAQARTALHKLNPSSRKGLTTANHPVFPPTNSPLQHPSSNAAAAGTSTRDRGRIVQGEREVITAPKPSSESDDQLSIPPAIAQHAEPPEAVQDRASGCSTTFDRVNTSSSASEGTRKSPTRSLRPPAGEQDQVGLNDASVSHQLDDVWPALTPDVKGVNVTRSNQSSMTLSLHSQHVETAQAGSAITLDVQHPARVSSG